MANYPVVPAVFTTKVDGDVLFASHMNAVQNEIVAVTTGLLQGLGHVVKPGADATYDLGTISRRWRDAWLSRNLTVGGDTLLSGDVHVVGDVTVDGAATFPVASIPWASVNKTGSSLADLITRNASAIVTPAAAGYLGATDLESLLDIHQSSGVQDGTVTFITAGTAGTISVAGGNGYLRTSNSPTAPLVAVSWSAVANHAISAPASNFETVLFVGVEYNSGTPQVVFRTSFDWNWYSDFPLGRVTMDDAGTRFILNAYAHSEDTANLTRKWLRLTHPFIREEAPEGSGGLLLGEAGTRNVTVTTGNIWHGYNKYTIPALNTAVTGNFETHYRAAGGGFATATATQWPNTQYDNGTGTLAAVGAGKYANLWFYVDSATGGIHMMYGRNTYNTLAAAQAGTGPATLPDHLTYTGKLIGRFIFQNGGASATSIESAWVTTFGASGISDHNQLSNLQGGTGGEYYHLTSAQQALVATTWPGYLDQAVKVASSPTFAGLTVNAFAFTVSGAPTLNDWFNQSVKTTAKPVFTSLVLSSIISPGALGSTTNDWNPTGLATATVIQVNTSTGVDLTGIVAQETGRILILTNVSGNFLTLKHNTGSASANVFFNPNFGDIALGTYNSVVLYYNGSNWRVAAKAL